MVIIKAGVWQRPPLLCRKRGKREENLLLKAENFDGGKKINSFLLAMGCPPGLLPKDTQHHVTRGRYTQFQQGGVSPLCKLRPICLDVFAPSHPPLPPLLNPQALNVTTEGLYYYGPILIYSTPQ